MNVPNEPYTPVAENVSISYTAKETRIFQDEEVNIDTIEPTHFENTSSAYEQERMRWFHTHPFGLKEIHNHLRFNNFKFGVKEFFEQKHVKSEAVGHYCNGGYLYIGLSNASPGENISLLIQVLEGSENPETISFEPLEQINWAVLCNNDWKDVQNQIISNETDNFLKSGIIKFAIPREANTDNTWMPKDRIWIKAQMQRGYDAVCKIINIHTQAVEAELLDQGNNLAHLNNGLPANTIKKLVTRVPQVRGVSQPYNSFGGHAEETDLVFYRRISERLRHKGRAVSLWDYEHLILEEFPEIFRVKCLNHTQYKAGTQETMCYNSAGAVTLVVVPDIINKNVFDLFEPRASKALLNRITLYINQWNTKQVTATVINPIYEAIAIELEVRFYQGFDEEYYKKILNEDIIKFLSPWAYDETAQINFGKELHASVLVDYIEKLNYVDYLQNLKIKKDGVIQK